MKVRNRTKHSHWAAQSIVRSRIVLSYISLFGLLLPTPSLFSSSSSLFVGFFFRFSAVAAAFCVWCVEYVWPLSLSRLLAGWSLSVSRALSAVRVSERAWELERRESDLSISHGLPLSDVISSPLDKVGNMSSTAVLSKDQSAERVRKIERVRRSESVLRSKFRKNGASTTRMMWRAEVLAFDESLGTEKCA